MAVLAALILVFVSVLYVSKHSQKDNKATAASGTVTLTSKSDWQLGINVNTDLSNPSPDGGDIGINLSSLAKLDLLGIYNANHASVVATADQLNVVNAIDGDSNSVWAPCTNGPCTLNTWTIDLGSTYTISKLRTLQTAVAGYAAQLSINGTDFTTLCNAGNQSPSWNECPLSPVQPARYIRLSGGVCGFAGCGGMVRELEAYKAGVFATHTSASTQLDGTSTFQHWDSFVPDATIPANSSIAFRFRTSPDSTTWSSWSVSIPYAASISLSGLSQQRYLQVESTLTSTDGVANPALHAYTANYTRDSTCDGFSHLTISPSTVSILTGGTADFTALAVNSGGSSMPGATLSYSADSGTINSSGHYTAPSTPGTYTVTATSSCGGSVTASVVVSAPVVDTCANFDHVSISPKSATVSTGQTLSFTISSFNHDGSSNLSPATASASGGSISGSVLTAPSTPGTYTVTATSACGSTDTLTVTVKPANPSPKHLCFGQFNVPLNQPCDAILPQIQVISPNGGESSQIGRDLPLSFRFHPGPMSQGTVEELRTKKNSNVFIDLYLTLDDGSYQKIISDVDYTRNSSLTDASGTALGSGDYLKVETVFPVPKDLSYLTQKARILARYHTSPDDSPASLSTATDPHTALVTLDTSDQVFSLTSPDDYLCLVAKQNGYCPPKDLFSLDYLLTIFSPKENDSWSLNSDQTIRWHLKAAAKSLIPTNVSGNPESSNQSSGTSSGADSGSNQSSGAKTALDLSSRLDPVLFQDQLAALLKDYVYAIYLSTNNGLDNYPIVLATDLNLKDHLLAEQEMKEITVGTDPALVTKQARVKLVLLNQRTNQEIVSALSGSFRIRSHSLIAGLFNPENWPDLALGLTLVLAALGAFLRLLPALANLLSFTTLSGLLLNLLTRLADFFGLLLLGLKKKRLRGLVYDSATLEPIPGARVLLLRVEDTPESNLSSNLSNKSNESNESNLTNSPATGNQLLASGSRQPVTDSGFPTTDNQQPAPDSRLISTSITDSSGHFQLALSPGSYRLLALKEAFVFPSEFVKQREFQPIENNYFGQTFRVEDYSSARDLDFNLPLDNQDPELTRKLARVVKRVNLLERALVLLNFPLLLVGSLISALAVYAQPSIFNLIILALYLPLWLSCISVSLKFNAWGKAVDQSSGNPLELVLVRAYISDDHRSESKVGSEKLKVDPTNQNQTIDTFNFKNFKLGRLARTVVTDRKGRFYLRLSEGNYNLVASKTDYASYKPRKLRIFRGLDFVNLVLRLLPKRVSLRERTSFGTDVLGGEDIGDNHK